MPWNSLDFRKGVELKEEVDENEFDDHFLCVVREQNRTLRSLVILPLSVLKFS